MFRGHNQINLDAKGRLAIPARYRDALLESAGGEMIATVYPDRCLLLYPRPEWDLIEEKLVALPSLNPTVRALQRLLMGYATDMQMDSHGRVLVAPSLRDYAELDHKVVMIGQGNKFELWSDDRWNASQQTWLKSMEDGGIKDSPELSALSL